jgi:hypothetical protein
MIKAPKHSYAPKLSTQKAATSKDNFFHPRAKSTSFFSSKKNFSFFNIQPKLSFGESGDAFELEAEKMAKRVSNDSPSHSSAPSLQRMCEDCKDELSAKLENPSISTYKSPNLQPEVQKMNSANLFEEGEGAQAKKESTQNGNRGASKDFENQLYQSRGGGQALPSNVMHEMNHLFKADFNKVRVHNGSNAIQMNEKIGSQAFTNRNNIYFNKGKFDPSGYEGKKLLAHELTHTIHQGAVQQMSDDYA